MGKTIAVWTLTIFLFILGIVNLHYRSEISQLQTQNRNQGNQLSGLLDRHGKLENWANKLQVPQFLSGSEVEITVIDPQADSGWVKIKLPQVGVFYGNSRLRDYLSGLEIQVYAEGRPITDFCKIRERLIEDGGTIQIPISRGVSRASSVRIENPKGIETWDLAIAKEPVLVLSQ